MNIAILLVLPFEETGLQPELSSPPRFRIQGGYRDRDGQMRSPNGSSYFYYWIFNSILFRRVYYNKVNIQTPLILTPDPVEAVVKKSERQHSSGKSRQKRSTPHFTRGVNYVMLCK